MTRVNYLGLKEASCIAIRNFAGVIIVGNGIAMIIRIIQPSDSLVESVHGFAACWDTFLFGGRE